GDAHADPVEGVAILGRLRRAAATTLLVRSVDVVAHRAARAASSATQRGRTSRFGPGSWQPSRAGPLLRLRRPRGSSGAWLPPTPRRTGSALRRPGAATRRGPDLTWSGWSGR